MKRHHFRTIVVGGGPAGIAPLVAASRDGRLERLLASGTAIIERGARVGAGSLGDYGIMSDSTAATFLTAVEGHLDPRLRTLQHSPTYRALKALGRSCAPLELAADLMRLVGDTMASAVTDAGGRIFHGHEAVSAHRNGDGSWRVCMRSAGGAAADLVCEHLLIATGGHQSRDRLCAEAVGGMPLLPRHGDRVVLSDDILRRGGVAHMERLIAGLSAPRVAIAGASTSAFAVATLLLRTLPDRFGDSGSLTILHRRPTRIFYASVDAARAEGYDAFGPEDICPVSGFVYRLAGLREESRELAMSMLGVGGRAPEARARFHLIEESRVEETHATLERADLVVAALGYRPNLLPLFERDGSPIRLAAQNGEPAVDGRCRIVDAGGEPVAGVLGIGLAAGFRPSGRLGGEPSFRGQANGLWLWQNGVGSAIIDLVLDPPATTLAACA